MRKRQIGPSDLVVSEIGLGCMSLGTDEQKATIIIESALEQGITHFDTADLYDFGENERIVGRALKPYRDKVVLATKAGNRWSSDRSSWSWDPSKAYLKQAIEKSLIRLDTDYIDLFQLHGGTIDDPITETIEAFEELKKEGYIRQYGISSIRPNVINEYITKSSIVSIMMQYNLLDRRPEEWFPTLSENGISAIARGSVAKGLLTDEMFNKASDHIQSQGYQDYSFADLQVLLPSLKEKLVDRTMNEIAIQYILSQKTVATVVAGASSVEQLHQNVHAAQAEPLTENEVKLIQQLTKLNLYENHR